MKRPLLVSLFMLSILCLQSQDLKIPEYINYEYAPKGVNDASSSLLKKEVANPEYALFGDTAYLGPKLWDSLKNTTASEIEKGNVIFQVPQIDGSTTKKEGKLIQTQNDFKTVWDLILKGFSDSDFTVRKLNIQELEYYWSIIFYDIQEPLYILENNTSSIIIDMDDNKKLLFIERFQ